LKIKSLQNPARLQYETDVRVPFFARGPGIPGGIISDYQATMVDLPATILSLAGGWVLGVSVFSFREGHAAATGCWVQP
jgi:arylsulfatase A-like enzyme